MKRWLIIPALAGLLITGGCGSEQAAVPTESSSTAPGNAPAGEHASTEGEARHAEGEASHGKETAGKVKVKAGPWAKVDASKYKTTESGLTYAVLAEGKGAVAGEGQDVAVHYTGWQEANGEKFDSSLDRNEPIHFPLGRGQVIPGWDEGIKGMKVGEKRQLVIPAKLAYADSPPPGSGIAPGATLIFDVELVDVHASH